MDSARWQQIQDLFLAALEIAPSARAAFVSDHAGDDDDLASRVAALLDADAADGFLDTEVGQVALGVLDDARQGRADPAVALPSIGPYRLIRPLGEGGTGIVYLAVRDDIGHEVAIKVLRDAWVSEERRDRFTREQRTLAKLAHPAIARVLDAGVLDSGTPWFAMERVQGVALDVYCRQHGLGAASIVQIVRDVAAAVQHAHERLIIHRDLKPSNILVEESGRPRLLDFGIARQLELASESATPTGASRILTPGYASPEELRGEVPGVQADVYSLGIVLRDLLAAVDPQGRGGWWGPGAHRSDRTARRDLDLIVRTAAHVDQAFRYGTAEAFVRDLDAWLEGRPLTARPPSLGYRTRRFVSRNRRRLGAAAVIVAAVTMLAGAYAQRLAVAQAESLAEARRSERLLRFLLDLFDGGQGDGAAPADLRVVAMLARGVAAAAQLRDDPRAQAELYVTLGQAYLDLGDLPQADRLLSDALAHRRAQAESSPAEFVRALVAASNVRIAQNRVDDAKALADEALSRSAAAFPPPHPVWLEATTAVARAAQERGDHKQTVATLDGALAVVRPLPENARQRATALSMLSDAYFYLDDMSRAERAALDAMAITSAARGAAHVGVGHLAVNLGAIAQTRGRFEDAETHFRHAEAIFREWYGADNPETASARISLGQMLSRQGRHTEALSLIEQALATQERVYGAKHRRTAFAQNERGLVAMRLNDLTTAEAAFREAIAGYHLATGTRFQEGVSVVNLATVFMNRGDLQQAEALFRDGLRIYAEALPPDHLRVGIAHGRLGRALLRGGRHAEARVALLEAERILVKQPDPAPLAEVRADLAQLR